MKKDAVGGARAAVAAQDAYLWDALELSLEVSPLPAPREWSSTLSDCVQQAVFYRSDTLRKSLN